MIKFKRFYKKEKLYFSILRILDSCSMLLNYSHRNGCYDDSFEIKIFNVKDHNEWYHGLLNYEIHDNIEKIVDIKCPLIYKSNNFLNVTQHLIIENEDKYLWDYLTKELKFELFIYKDYLGLSLEHW